VEEDMSTKFVAISIGFNGNKETSS